MQEKPKILFVDDEKRILTSLRVIFRTNYEVFLASSGPEALEIVHREHPHVVVSDQRMPEMLGHELLREVKRLSPDSMRLLLTGYSDLSAIISSINDGEVFRFIHKPWNVDEIREIVASAAKISMDTAGSVGAEILPDVERVESNSGVTHHGAGVLIVDDQYQALIAQVRRLDESGLPVHGAESLDEALARLSGEEIAVLIIDVVVGGQDTTEFIKVLKQEYPLVMTIVLTEAVDADAAVELINQGQVYRYLKKPVGDNALLLSVRHGLMFYCKNKRNPLLLRRQKVETFVPQRNPSLAAKISSRLHLWRQRWQLFQGGEQR